MKRILPFLLCLSLVGCSMAPKYERPDAPVDEAWPGGSVSATQAAAEKSAIASHIGWREFFTDVKLQKLIEQALANNRDLRIAALNVEKARAQYRIKRADLFPTVDGTAGASYDKVAKTLSGTGSSVETETYRLGVGFTSYEIDLFGRINNLKKQALEQYLSLEETRTSAQITLVSEVASAYLALLADQSLLRLSQDTLKSQQESYNLIQKSYDNGVASELDLKQSETAVRTAEVNIAQYTRNVALDKNALNLLLGNSLPEEIWSDLSEIKDLDVNGILTELPAGLPSDLLERRPDIRAAEHDLKGANANVGAARAAFFPSITLTASVGTASDKLSGLFVNGSGVWQFAPQIRVPIFDGGVNAANLDVAKVSKNIYVAQYEKAIQSAFREVADGLASRATLQDQIKAQELLVQATEKSYHLYELRYRNGVDNYVNVLLWQRSLYSAQQGLVSTRLSYLSNLVTLYKTLGGGWTEYTPQ